ncbi:ABC transporter permease [Salinibaculum rarum]|uniref:ABC transporter permease n=1 Tax=Salinibaculum rarum TaxID=3058903 RepID=UPI00265F23CB|nr:ABC transporter permease [Salinibaculum sp. KK48]
MSDSDRGLLGGARATIARREISSLSREKTIVLALLIQLFIAAFSSFLVVGLTSLYDPSSVEGEGVRIGVSGEYQDELVSAAAQTEGVQPVRFDSRESALEGFNNGQVNAIVAAERSPEANGSRIAVTAIAPEENIRTTLIIVQLREMLTELERTERQQRQVYLDYRPVEPPADADSSPYFGFTYTVLIPLLLFLPPFISGSISVDAITEEIERGTLELLRVAPVSLVDIVDGKALGMILLAPLQALLWIVLLSFNNIAVQNVVPLLVFVTAIATIVVAVGTLLGLITARRRQAQLLYSVLVILLFGAAIVLPEHPATTVAKLAVDSATTGTYAHVVAFSAVAVGVYALARRYAGSIDAESF